MGKPVTCSVPGCGSKIPRFQLFDLPCESNVYARSQWIKFLSDSGKKVDLNRRNRICELHFPETYFKNKKQKQTLRVLYDHALPMIKPDKPEDNRLLLPRIPQKITKAGKLQKINPESGTDESSIANKHIRVKATVVTHVKDPFLVSRFRHPYTAFGKSRKLLDDHMLNVLATFQTGLSNVVKFSKSKNFQNPTFFRDVSDMHVQLISIIDDSKVMLETLQGAIKKDMNLLKDFVAEDIKVLGGISKSQKTEDEDDLMIVEQPVPCVHVTSDEETEDETEVRQHFVVAESYSLAEAPPEINFEEQVASTSCQNVEVFQGFTISTFDPGSEPDVDYLPATSIKNEPIEGPSSQMLNVGVQQPRVTPMVVNSSRIHQLHENLRLKLKTAKNRGR